MYSFTTSTDAKASDHYGHASEEWNAYLSSEYPEWATANATGLCCHTCSLIIVETF